MGDEVNEKKRKNKSKYVDFKKLKPNPNNLDVNQKGFVVTCNFKEQQAVTEAYNILNSLAPFNKEPTTSENVDGDLQRELEQLKSERPFKQAVTNCKNVVFIRVPDDRNPVELMNSIYETVDRDQSINCRYINKMMPIQITTAVTKKSILDNLTTILRADADEKATFRIEIVSRINFKLSKDELITEIGQLVTQEKPNWTVDLKQPKKLIYIDVLFKICGLAILDDYFQRSKYNLNVYCKKAAEGSTTGDSNGQSKNENGSLKEPVTADTAAKEGGDDAVSDLPKEDTAEDETSEQAEEPESKTEGDEATSKPDEGDV